jgi:hypothetical protein
VKYFAAVEILEFVQMRLVVKSHWMTLFSVVAALLFLLLSRRLDLLLIVVPLSALVGWLTRRDSVSGQRRI